MTLLPKDGTPPPKEIGRANEFDVRVVWQDDHVSVFPARDLRLICPCAECVSEDTGERILVPAAVPDDVHPLGIEPVGRYAIQIRWSDGHSTGLYSFDYLRENCPCERCRAGGSAAGGSGDS
jgi:DUF971 family protein